MRFFKRSQLATAFIAVLALGSSRSADAVEVAFEHDSSLPLVYLNVALKAGSVADPAGESGVTNFMGEMLLRGTRSQTKQQIDLMLDQMGAKLEVETRAEATILRGAVVASQLEPFLKLLSVIITEPSFPETEIRKLRSEIVSGILEELGNDRELANRRFARFMFGAHPYGNPVLGTITDVKNLSRARIVKQYDRLVQDSYLLVVGAGDARAARIDEWAKSVAKARSGTAGKEAAYRVAKPADPAKRRLMIVDKPDRTQTQINAGHVGIRMTDPKFFPLYLGNYAFGGGSFSARLMVEIRVKKGWSYGANSFFRHGLEPRSWQFLVFPASKDAANALALSLKMVEELKARGITAEEFTFSRDSLVNGAGFMYNTPKKRVENKLLERTLDLPDDFMKTYGPELSKVSVDQVNAALREYLRPDKLSISVVGTAAELKEPLAKAAGVPVSEVIVKTYTEE